MSLGSSQRCSTVLVAGSCSFFEPSTSQHTQALSESSDHVGGAHVAFAAALLDTVATALYKPHG
jgi:hypothetical protein